MMRSPSSFLLSSINLRGYDSYYILENIGKFQRQSHVIAFGNLRFINLLQFMGTSLEKLVGNLAQEGKDKFYHMCHYIPNPDQQELLLCKGVLHVRLREWVKQARRNITTTHGQLLQFAE